MENHVIRNLSTAIEITPKLRADLLSYLKEYCPQSENESELLRVLTGVLELHNEKTRDFLKYTDFQILSIIRQMYFYGFTLTRAEESIQYMTQSGFILQTMRGNNNAVMVTKLKYRQLSNELEEIKTKLLGVHSIDLTAVRIENHKGNESYKLSLIERKSELESLLDEYKAVIDKTGQVKADINKWFRSEAPAEIRESVKGLNDYSSNVDSVLSPYIEDIAKYANMNE